ncbi:MAG: hypothetical protein KDC26_07485 [Armatimonadetes bacterium]|nr:hypothetical protein [Armatimonadota bacterium]
MSKLNRLLSIIKTYTYGRKGDKPSTASFWYMRAPATIFTPHHLEIWRKFDGPYPPYLFDHRSKLDYPSVREDGVALLNYDDPIGTQVNPEAAFQYALGLADAYLNQKRQELRTQFLSCCNYFLSVQDERGNFPYEFDWYESKAPWYSALAQSRGVSVMLRAWKMTGDEKYLRSARLAVSQFMTPIEDGGYLATFGPESCTYFEEYPHSPSAVMNGFLATAFGLFELNELAPDEPSQVLFDLSIESLKKMLPHYTLDWWTLYDLRGQPDKNNVQSPFYHDMVIQYITVLAIIAPCPEFERICEIWKDQYTISNKLRATLGKIVFKVNER